MSTSTENKEEEEEQQQQQQQPEKMSNSTDRLPHHVSFNDDQRQQPQIRKTSINLDDLPSTSRHGLSKIRTFFNDRRFMSFLLFNN